MRFLAWKPTRQSLQDVCSLSLVIFPAAHVSHLSVVGLRNRPALQPGHSSIPGLSARGQVSQFACAM